MKKMMLLISLLLLSVSAQAKWILDEQNSSVYFVSTKKSAVAEVHYFKQLSGLIENNTAKVSLNLASVESNIEKRNERMKKMLFNIEHFAQANIRSQVDEKKLAQLKVGEQSKIHLNLQLDLHGIHKELTGSFNVIKLTQNRIYVSSTRPIIINAHDYKLAQGVEALRKVAKLPSISTAVPVVFQLVFKQ